MYYYATDSCIYMFHAFFVKHFESLKVLYNFCISSLLLVVVMMKNMSVVLGVSYKEVDLCSWGVHPSLPFHIWCALFGPPGKLTKDQIKAGYEALKDIETLINKKDFSRHLTEACSNFYTRIPHDFGWVPLIWPRSFAAICLWSGHCVCLEWRRVFLWNGSCSERRHHCLWSGLCVCLEWRRVFLWNSSCSEWRRCSLWSGLCVCLKWRRVFLWNSSCSEWRRHFFWSGFFCDQNEDAIVSALAFVVFRMKTVW